VLQRLDGAVDVLPQRVVDVGGEEVLERGQAALGGGAVQVRAAAFP
jgi:hypothetical protein